MVRFLRVKTFWLFLTVLYFFWVVLSLRLRSEYSLLEFSGLHYCLFVKVHLHRRLKNTDVRLSYNIRKIFECQLIPEIFFNFFHKAEVKS